MTAEVIPIEAALFDKVTEHARRAEMAAAAGKPSQAMTLLAMAKVYRDRARKFQAWAVEAAKFRLIAEPMS